MLRSVAVSYHVQLLRQRVAVFLHNHHLLLRACCLYCLLPFYQSILSSLRRSVTSTSSGAESSVKAFFHFAKIIIFSENLSFFCCFFSFFAPTFVAFAVMFVAFASMIVAFASMILLSYSSFECLPPASFRFHLAVAPLLLAIQFPLLGLVRDLHPLDVAHAERTNKEALSGLPYMESAVCVCMTGC